MVEPGADAAGLPSIEPLPWHGSADLRATSAADGFAIFAAGDRDYVPGEIVDFLPMRSFEVSDMTSVAAPEQETHSIETAGLRDRVSRHRMVAGIASGFLLWTSFPPVEWSWLAWIALVPLFWLATLRGASHQDLPGRMGRGPGLLAARPRMGPDERRQAPGSVGS